MTASWTTAPHFYLFREVTVGRLAAWRQQAEKQTGGRITYSDVLVKLVAAALARHPAVNASWRDGTITRHAEINIGLAVAVEDGLIVPVIHRADTLGLAAIAARREDVVTRAQGTKLRPADIQGGTFTISNLGMYGVDAFNAIVNPPQAAILAVGAVQQVPVVKNAEARSLTDLAAEIRRVTEAARSNKATRDELTGSTITVTSLGKLGGIASTPVINAPEVAIVGVNKAVERPVVVDGSIAIRRIMNLSSSFDHRFVDGFDAAAMIQALKEKLEHPATIFIQD